MRSPIQVTEVVFVPAADDSDASTIGWVSFVVDGGVRIDGRLVLDADDGSVHVSHLDEQRSGWSRGSPIEESVHVEIERQVLAAIDRGSREAS